MTARSSEDILGQLEPFGMKLGLERIQRLCAAQGNPHLALPIVLIAGTNGKGSTGALLAAFCRAAGYRIGLYTSPHLETVTERLSINGSSIDEPQLVDYLDRGLETAAKLEIEPPTSFEALTLAALLYFRDAAIDLAIMEVGLGGRYDATNVGTPELSIIASISLDHERHLGESLETIATEKSGVLRAGKPAVAWPGDAMVQRVLSEQAATVGADITFVEPNAASALTPASACPQRIQLRTPLDTYVLELFLPGRHQLGNLNLAVRAAETLSQRGWPALDAAAITRGTASCRWPGRLEWIEVGGGQRVLLDAAHNAAGLEALIDYVEDLDERPDLLFGALEEKSIDGMLPRLAAAVHRVVLTRPPTERAAAPERWSRHFMSKPTQVATDPRRALDDSLAACKGTLLVCGSLFLVGRVRTLLRRRFGVPPPPTTVQLDAAPREDQGNPS